MLGLRFFVRKIKIPVRFPSQASGRTQPPPNLPEGPSGSLSGNSYCARDARRINDPPTTVFLAGQKLLQSGEGTPQKSDSPTVKKVPGLGFDYGGGQGYFSR